MTNRQNQKKTGRSQTGRQNQTRTTSRLSPTHRERILQHLEMLKIPLSAAELDELLSWADQQQISQLELLERVLAAPASFRRERSRPSGLGTPTAYPRGRLSRSGHAGEL